MRCKVVLAFESADDIPNLLKSAAYYGALAFGETLRPCNVDSSVLAPIFRGAIEGEIREANCLKIRFKNPVHAQHCVSNMASASFA